MKIYEINNTYYVAKVMGVKRKENEKMKEKNNVLRNSLVLLTIGLVSGIAFVDWNLKDWFITEKQDNQEISELETSIIENRIKLKLLTTSETEDGSITKTFSYTITPANATNQNVTATAKYKDGTSCSSVLTTSVNSTDKTISIVCKSAFAQQIEVVVTSEANENAKATIKVDYVKKVTNATYNSESIQYILGEEKAINYSNFIDITYSQYSKNKDYSIKFNKVTLGECNIHLENGNPEIFTGIIKLDIKNYLSALIGQPTSSISKAAIWGIQLNNNYHSLLVANSTGESYISYNIDELKLDIVDSNDVVQKSVNIENKTLYLYLACDWSGYTVNVDSLNVEFGNVEF